MQSFFEKNTGAKFVPAKKQKRKTKNEIILAVFGRLRYHIKWKNLWELCRFCVVETVSVWRRLREESEPAGMDIAAGNLGGASAGRLRLAIRVAAQPIPLGRLGGDRRGGAGHHLRGKRSALSPEDHGQHGRWKEKADTAGVF